MDEHASSESERSKHFENAVDGHDTNCGQSGHAWPAALKSITDSEQFSDIKFEYPQPTITAESAANYRMIAEPDDKVPAEYWLWDEPPREPWRTPSGGKMHIIARRGKGMGPSEKPNAVQSMESLPNSQTTYNGGGTRPRLDWQMN